MDNIFGYETRKILFIKDGKFISYSLTGEAEYLFNLILRIIFRKTEYKLEGLAGYCAKL